MSIHSDVVIVGSGMNSLSCAALLAVRGLKVTVLERNPVAGGCIRTEELFPGFTHDLFSSWYPLFLGGPAYAALAPYLEQAGVRFVKNDYSTGLAIPGGPSVALRQDWADTAQRLDALYANDGTTLAQTAEQIFGADAALIFGLMGNEPYSKATLKMLYKEWRHRGLDGLMGFASHSLENFRRWSERELSSDFSRALIAPWVLHSGLGPDEASSALIGKLTFSAVVAGGMPVVQGGSYQLVKAFIDLIEQHGGHVLTQQHVDQIVTTQGKATGVKVGDQLYSARKAVVCNVTPNQLYQQLLPEAAPRYKDYAASYRYGRGGMQIHFALDAPPQWTNPELLQVPLVHVTESMEQVCASVVAANNGWLPAKPTLAVGQPVAIDPSRAPEGKWILWVQMQDMPTTLRADEANEIALPADGKWNPSVREAVVQRVQQRLEHVMPGFSQQIIGHQAYSPADLESWNINLVGGDPYSGVCSPDQFFFMRPFAGDRHARTGHTPIKNLHHIGASVHPGPGLGGQSGYLAAQRIAPAKN